LIPFHFSASNQRKQSRNEIYEEIKLLIKLEKDAIIHVGVENKQYHPLFISLIMLNYPFRA